MATGDEGAAGDGGAKRSKAGTKARGREFAALVHRVIVVEERYSLKAVAERMNLDYATLYGRISNRVAFSAEEIRALIAAAPDPRLAAFLLLGTPFIPADRFGEDGAASLADSLRTSVIRMLIEAGGAADAIERALADGLIDHREAISIGEEIVGAERAIASLREHVRRATGRRAAS